MPGTPSPVQPRPTSQMSRVSCPALRVQTGLLISVEACHSA